MPLKLYMDQHVQRSITDELRRRGIDVLTAFEDGADELDDAVLLDRATTLGRILFSRDADLLAQATRRQREGLPFAGLVYAHQLHVSIGNCIEGLELVAVASSAEEQSGRITYLPI
jgi:hypothetical protein